MVGDYITALDVKVSVLAFDGAVRLLESFVGSGRAHCICVNSAQDIMIAQKNERFKQIVNSADLAIPDGMPLVWISRLRGYTHAERVTGPDLMEAMCARSPETGHTHFFYGGKEGVPERLAAVLGERFPGLKVAGGYSPPFRPLTPEEDETVIKMINDSGADFVWVGLGTPKQHYWIADHLGRLHVAAIAGVGAAFDYHCGNMKRAPQWMQAHGLEWLFRLTHYPGPVWRRYVEYLPAFACRAGWEVVRDVATGHRRGMKGERA
jgi:N-acetylglucosaminyldiphosphoundecaprenol N-acetyl-beta-D-mannosaminyltransferase